MSVHKLIPKKRFFLPTEKGPTPKDDYFLILGTYNITLNGKGFCRCSYIWAVKMENILDYSSEPIVIIRVFVRQRQDDQKQREKDNVMMEAAVE